ncbi:hypothetical protein NEIG_00687 [Nematocida sp. ERTm5]|nr:hypothetical protein NEIG_00687 [Nematocida sp. ERTm5]
MESRKHLLMPALLLCLVALCWVNDSACAPQNGALSSSAGLGGLYTDKIAHIDEFSSEEDDKEDRPFEIIQDIPENIVLSFLFLCCAIIGYYIGVYLERLFMYADYIKKKISWYCRGAFLTRQEAPVAL